MIEFDTSSNSTPIYFEKNVSKSLLYLNEIVTPEKALILISLDINTFFKEN